MIVLEDRQKKKIMIIKKKKRKKETEDDVVKAHSQSNQWSTVYKRNLFKLALNGCADSSLGPSPSIVPSVSSTGRYLGLTTQPPTPPHPLLLPVISPIYHPFATDNRQSNSQLPSEPSSNPQPIFFSLFPSSSFSFYSYDSCMSCCYCAFSSYYSSYFIRI